MATPMPTFSTMRWNSLARGSGLSRAMIFRQSCTGRPDLMPRTMMSMASEKASVNFLMRRLARKLTTQRGRPRPAAKATPRPISGFWVNSRAIAPRVRPKPLLMIQRFHARGQPGLLKPGGDGQGGLPLLAILVLEGLQDLLAADFLVVDRGRRTRAPGAGVARPGADDRLGALDGLGVGGVAAGEHEAEAGDGDEGEDGREEHHHRAIPPRRGPRPARAPGRNSGRGPRSVAGRCRWSGTCR